MQTYLTNLETMLLNWYAIIMQNPLYKLIFMVAVAALVIWFIVVLYYQIKVSRLRSNLHKLGATHEVHRNELNTEIETLKDQLLQTENELTERHARVEQLESEKLASNALIERTKTLEKQAKQLVENLQTEFYLPNFTADGSVDLSQQLNNIVQMLVDRLKAAMHQQLESTQAYQQARNSLATKEETISVLNTQLEAQTLKSSEIEHNYQMQTQNLLEQLEQLQHEVQLAQTNSQANVGRIAQLEQHNAQLGQQLAAAPIASAVDTAAVTTQPQAELSFSSTIAVDVTAPAVKIPDVETTVIASVVQVVESEVETIKTVAADTFNQATEVVEEKLASPKSNQFSRIMGSFKSMGAAKKEKQPKVIKEDVLIPVVDVPEPQGVRIVQAVVKEVEAITAVEKTPAMAKLKNMMHFKKSAPPVKASENETPVEAEPMLDAMLEKLEGSNINKYVPEKLKDIYKKIMSA